jgi:PKD repeat protein
VDRVRASRTDVPEPPEATFSWTPVSLSVSLGANPVFSDESSDDGEILRWKWDFGDPQSGAANTSGDPNPQHSFRSPGTYRVALTVEDDQELRATVVRAVVVEP